MELFGKGGDMRAVLENRAGVENRARVDTTVNKEAVADISSLP